MAGPTIIYTHTDEAPALATYSLLPVVRAYAATAGVSIETRDISLAGRIIASFPERLEPEQRIGDALAELRGLTYSPFTTSAVTWSRWPWAGSLSLNTFVCSCPVSSTQRTRQRETFP